MEQFRYHSIPYHRVEGSPSAFHAVTPSDLRIRLRLDPDESDSDLTLMIAEAEAWWRGVTFCHLLSQTSALHLDRFPATTRLIDLAHAPIVAVDSVTYTDPEGADQTWAAANYQAELGTRGGRLLAKVAWPSTDSKKLDAVRISMTVGYADAASVPADVKAALLLYAGARYRYREEIAHGGAPHVIPQGAASIANRYRLSLLPREVY